MSDISTIRRNGVCLALLSSLFVLVSQQASAAGFALRESSASNLGTAFAGAASSATDASTGYYNPAGLGEFKHPQAIVSGAYIKGKIKLYGAKATNNISTTPISGNDPTKPKSNGFVPGLHYVHPVNHKWALGFNVTVPFGLNTKYQGQDFARYMATESKIMTLDFSPSFSYRVNDKLSVGAGLDALYVKATLAAAAHVTGEGYLINRDAHGWAYGHHLGLLYKSSHLTKMGLTYHSRFTPRVRGHALSNSTGFLPAEVSMTSQVSLPDRIVYGVTHEYNDIWTVMSELEWTHWSRFKTVKIDYATTSHQVKEYFFFKNAYRLSFGADYKYSQPLTLRGGLAYEQSPDTNSFRAARLPDSNRYWLAIGAKYKINKNISIDGGYAHLFFKKASIAQRGVGDDRTLFGNYKSSADIVGVQLSWNFV